MPFAEKLEEPKKPFDFQNRVLFVLEHRIVIEHYLLVNILLYDLFPVLDHAVRKSFDECE